MCAQKNSKTSVPKTKLMTKLRLNVSERLAIHRIFPKEGSMLQQRIKRSIYDKCELSDEEVKTLNPTDFPDGSMFWKPENAKKIPLKTIKLNDVEIKELLKYANDLDGKNKVPDGAFTLCEKILEVKKPEKEEKEEENEPS